VGAADVTTSVTTDGAHVGVAHTTASVVGAGAHVGTADVTTSVTDEVVVVRRASRLDAILHTQAKTALTALGWKPAIAAAAVAAAAAAQGAEVTLERLIFESLRRCPAPKA
jgi:L-fucose isomerase-like protein